MASNPTILLATGNAHKASEMAAILAPFLPVDTRLVTLEDVGLSSPPDSIERFKTFAANARAKAIWCAIQSGLPCIADDSGICVNALGGAPGVFSARWAGPDASDLDRCNKLLTELQKVHADSPDQRKARFVCACVYAAPSHRIDSIAKRVNTVCRMGSVAGEILHERVGDSGFGYDPIFYLPKYRASMAELGQEIKNKISHRSRALRSLATQIFVDMQ